MAVNNPGLHLFRAHKAPAPPSQVAAEPSSTNMGGSTAELITPAEAAGILCVSAKVLERWRGTGVGPAFVKLTSKTVRYRRDDIAAFVAEHVRSSTRVA